MPTKTKRLCPRCKRLVPAGPCPHCSKAWATSRRPADTRRKRRARRDRLVADPMCAGYPEPGSCKRIATEDDHVIPWAEWSGTEAAWDAEDNHQNLCHECHRAKTRDENLRALRARRRR